MLVEIVLLDLLACIEIGCSTYIQRLLLTWLRLLQLRECAAMLLMKLLDDKVPALMEGTQLLKALNVLMLKILDNCNR